MDDISIGVGCQVECEQLLCEFFLCACDIGNNLKVQLPIVVIDNPQDLILRGI